MIAEFALDGNGSLVLVLRGTAVNRKACSYSYARTQRHTHCLQKGQIITQDADLLFRQFLAALWATKRTACREKSVGQSPAAAFGPVRVPAAASCAQCPQYR